MTNRLSQKDRIMAHLWDYGEITSWEAIKEYGITRLSDLIYKLRNEGWNIENEWEHTKNRYGDSVKYVRYKLIKNDFWKNVRQNHCLVKPYVKCEVAKDEQHNN